MDAYRIAFTGPDNIQKQLSLLGRMEDVLREKLYGKERVEFYFCGDGDFAFLASLAAKKLQRECCTCDMRRFLLRAPAERDAPVRDTSGGLCRLADTTVIAREQFPSDRIDLLVAYVPPRKRNSMLRSAEQKGVEIINLATQES